MIIRLVRSMCVLWACMPSAAVVTGQVVTGQEVAPAAAPAESSAPDFNTHIAPIFKTYCQGCHSADNAEGELVLDSHETLLRGGASGNALVAGNPDQSRLLLVLDGRAEPKMPPEGSEAPTAEEIALIQAWIAAGAKSPTGAAPDPTLLITPSIAPLSPPRQVINAAALTADGQTAALAGYRTARLISTASRGVLRELGDQRGNVADIRFSQDGTRLITAAGEPGVFGEARLWNVADGALLQAFLGHTDSLYAAVLSPDGSIAATAGYDQTIKLWDAASGKELRALLGHNGAVFDLSFSPDGRILASASADRTVKLWDVASGERLDTLSQSLKEIYAVRFSPDGKQVVAAGADNRLRVWQISPTAREGSNPLVITRFAHDGAVIKLAYSPDGKLLASSAEDRGVKLWETAGYTEQRRLEDQPDWAPALAFSGDGGTLLVGRLDGSHAFYQTASGEPVPPAKPELTAVSPRGWQAGTTATLTLHGKNLLGATAINFSVPQLSGRVLTKEGATPEQLQVELTAAADAPRGPIQLSVQTAGGTSNATLLYLDGIPQITETEPNNDQASGTLLTLPAGVWGTLEARGDVDHYSFDATAGQTVVFEVAGKRFGSTINAVLTVLSPTGQVVASNNDYDGAEDPLVAYTIPAAGRYTVRISDLTLTGAATHFYRLAVGEFAFVTGSYPMSVAANTETDVELTGYNLPPGEKVRLAAAAAGEVEVPVDPARFRTRQPIKVLVAAEPQLLENEPNDAVDLATVLPAPGVIGARIAQPSDVDLFRFDAQAGETWIVEVDAARRGSPLDPKVEVLDAQGQPVVRLLLQAVRESYIDFRPMDSSQAGFRSKDFEEMDLNQFVYLQGEVGKIFRMPQGPDSDIMLYTLAGRRRCYFDTSATAHAFEEPFYIVEPHPVGAALVSNGLPVFPLHYVNDDDADRRLGRDSRLFFTAPATGSYSVRVTDVRGFGGDRFSYRLLVRRPRPDFRVALQDPNPTVARGSGRRLTFGIERSDGFEGDVTVQISNLPPGISSSAPVVIEAGHQDARAVLVAAADAPQPTEEQWQAVKIEATARIQDQDVTHPVNALGKITVADKPNLLVTLEPAELTIAPGTTITATLKIERNGFEEFVQFDVDNLPHGVIVDNIGLNGVLIPAGQSERQIFLTASKGVAESSRRFHAVGTNAGAQASAAILLHVRRPSPVAQAAGAASEPAQ